MRVWVSLTAVLCWTTVLAGCAGTVSPQGLEYLQAADTAFRVGDDLAAIEASSRFIELHPRLQEAGEAYYIRGLARCRAGRVGPGKDDLLAALNFTKRDDLIALVHCRLADMAYRAGDIDGSAKHYRTALKHTPPGAPPADEAMYRLGCILQRQGRWRDADLYFSRVMYLFDSTPLAGRAAERAHAVRWSVQAAAMREAVSARRLQGRLQRAGLDARTDLDLRDSRVVRLVRVGSYHTHRQARADLGKVRRIASDAFITPAR